MSERQSPKDNEDSMLDSEDLQPFFKVTKFAGGDQGLEMEQARETISHDQFLNPKPEFLAKLERQQAKFTLHMSVQRKDEDDESLEHSFEEMAPSNPRAQLQSKLQLNQAMRQVSASLGK